MLNPNADNGCLYRHDDIDVVFFTDRESRDRTMRNPPTTCNCGRTITYAANVCYVVWTSWIDGDDNG